jgi:hypothetical protein
MAMTEQQRISLSFLENYGLARLFQSSIPDAVELTKAHPEDSVRLYSMLLQAYQDRPDAGQRLTAYTSLASAIPLVGSLLSAAGGLLGSFASWLSGKTGGQCEKTYCPGSDKDARKYAVGLDPGNRWPDRGTHLAFAMHDGLIVQGPGATGTPDQFGRKKGAGPLYVDSPGKPSSFMNVITRANPFYGLGTSLPKGDWIRPWTTPNTYYWRAWRVGTMLKWAQGKMTCPQIRCFGFMMDKIVDAPEQSFSDMPGGWWETRDNYPGIDPKRAWALQSPATDLARRKGSRWYASLLMLHQDVGSLALSLPEQSVLEAAAAVSGTESFLTALGRVKRGEVPAGPLTPWPWWYATKELTFDQLRQLLLQLDAKNVAVTPRRLAPGASYLRRMGRVTRVQPQQQQQTSASTGGLLLPILGATGAGVGLVWLLTRKG